MAIQNNLREAKAWYTAASPHIVPSWELDIMLRNDLTSRSPTQRGVLPRPSTMAQFANNGHNTQISGVSRDETTSPVDYGSRPEAANLPQAPPAPPRPLVASTQINIDDISDFSDNDSQAFQLIDVAKLGMKRQSTLDTHMQKKPRMEREVPNKGTQNELNLNLNLKDVISNGLKPNGVKSNGLSSKDLSLNGLKGQTLKEVTSKDRELPSLSRGPPLSRGPSLARNPSLTRNPSLPTSDNNVSLLHEYVRICESKINLLTKSNLINESTSLSLDAKKLWHSNHYLPKFKDVHAKQTALRSKFTFLDPLPSTEDLSRLSSSNPVLSSMVSVSNDLSNMKEIVSSPESVSISRMPVEVATSPVHEEENEAFANNEANYANNEANHANNEANYGANNDEARRIIMENRARPKPPQVVEDDDVEDDFGEEFMDGLDSSQVDNDDTDLSGFLAKDGDDDLESVDETFSTPQATQIDSQPVVSDGFELDSENDMNDQQNLREEMKDMILSQDTAARYGVKYDLSEPIEISDDDNDASNMDFTTQLNENRDEVVEILSDDDLDAEDLNALTELLHIKVEYPKPKLLIVSDSDFSDDDDELIQLSKTVTTTLSKRVLPGSEDFIDEVYDVLHNIFKLPDFRSNQLEAIVATLVGKDVFVLIPTGGGKSLCYQLPALVQSGKTKGTTVVISPLISLMQDQVQHLLNKNIRAGMISSKGTSDERNATFRALTSGQLDLVYLSPEMVNNSARVQKVISKLYENDMLARIVVDEAHCVSSWGHDFRPDYKGMSIFKQQYPNVPVMALTATANEKVRLDIVHNLRMSSPVLLKQSFNRTNLFYEVKNKPPNFYEWVRDYVLNKQSGKTGIIYCHSKQSCETTAQKLNEWGIQCMFYHAGMDPNDRFEVQTLWQQNKIQLICATIAFGMGIDKPDVRFVIHMYIPRSLEGYYQETGRAGRDGKESECIMFYSYKDARSLQSLIQRDDKLEQSARETHLAKLRQVVQYCENQTDCRRRQVLHFFNETFEPKDCHKKCDNCCSEVISVTRDVTDHCVNIVKMVRSLQHDKVTVIHCQDVYKGSKSNKIMKLGHNQDPSHGMGKDLDRGDMERIFFQLQSDGCLLEYQVMKGGFASTYVKLGPNVGGLLEGNKRVLLSFAQNGRSNSSGSKPRLAPSGNGGGLTNFRYQESFVSAREVRYEQEKENIDWKEPRSKIVLSRQNFNGAVSEGNEQAIEHAFGELRNLRLQKLQELGYGRPTFFVEDDLLKEMAIKLPTNARDFAKLENISKEQVALFQYFKKTLGALSRERKNASQNVATQTSTVTQANSTISEHASPYFQRAYNSQPKRTQRSQGSQRKSNYKRNNKTGARANRGSRPEARKPASSGHIRQMPI